MKQKKKLPFKKDKISRMSATGGLPMMKNDKKKDNMMSKSEFMKYGR